MILITIITCALIQRFAKVGGWISGAIVEKYLMTLRGVLSKLGGWLGLVTAIIPFIAVLAVLNWLVIGRLYGLAHLLLMLIVLFLCVDMRTPKDLLKNYFIAMNNNETDEARKAANEFTLEPAEKKSSLLPRQVTKSIFIRSFTNVFAPIFWFLVLNIYGVVLYFLLVNFRKNSLKTDAAGYKNLAKAAAKAEDILNWIPMRLVALTYSLAGHFSDSFSYCYKKVISLSMETEFFIINTGMVALGVDLKEPEKSTIKENYNAIDLIDRSMLIWLGAVILVSFGKLIT